MMVWPMIASLWVVPSNAFLLTVRRVDRRRHPTPCSYEMSHGSPDGKKHLHGLIYNMTLFLDDMVDENGRFYSICTTGERSHAGHNVMRDLAAAWDASKALMNDTSFERLNMAMATTIEAYRVALIPAAANESMVLDSSMLQEPSHIGHSAMLILAGLGSWKLHHEVPPPSWIVQLARGILSMQRSDGAFGIAFENGFDDTNVYANIEFYPGEAMVALTEVYHHQMIDHSVREEIRYAMERAFDFYVRHYNVGETNVNYNIWQIQAFSRLYHMMERTSPGKARSIGEYVEALCWDICNSRAYKYELARGRSFFPNLSTIEIACGLDALADAIPVLDAMGSDRLELVLTRVQNGLEFLLWAEQQPLPSEAKRGHGGLGFGGTLILEQRLDVTGHALSAAIKLQMLNQ